jgi:hypothetical protein
LYISPKWESLPLDIFIENQQQNHFRTETTTAMNSIDIDNVITIPSSPSPILSPIISSATIPSTLNTMISSNSTVSSSSANSYNTPISRINNNSTPTSNSTIRSDQSTISTEITELSLYNNIDDFIQEIVVGLQLDNKVSGIEIITINNTINVVEEILNWIDNANNNDLLKKPTISVITER